jgi:hypothetical protein
MKLLRNKINSADRYATADLFVAAALRATASQFI